MATRVSMLGARCHSALQPLMKNRWLMTMTMAESSNSTRPTATWLPSKNPGSGKPHIMCPMDTYINTMRKPRDQRSRRRSFGVSVSFSSSSAADAVFCAAPFLLAP